MKKIIPILLPGLFSAAEILAALYLKRQIPAGSAGLSMAADLLLYAWIAYNGCSWTIGYKKIFIHGIWFFQEADVLLTRTAKKPFFCLCIPQAAVSTILFFLVPVFFISLSGGIAGGKNALNAVCVPQAVPQNNCKTALKSAYQMVSAFHSGREIRTLDTTGMNRML